MKFYSMVSNINYEIKPTRWEYHGPDPSNREKLQGIYARFSNHMYDTVAQQEANGWSDEQREMVENYLKRHENFNTQWLQLVPDITEPTDDFVASGKCISRTVTDEGVVDCDQMALKNEFYCRRHLVVPEKVS